MSPLPAPTTTRPSVRIHPPAGRHASSTSAGRYTSATPSERIQLVGTRRKYVLHSPEVFCIVFLERFRRTIQMGGATMAGVTLKTVAKAVGVSPSTVSNAYNKPDQLSTALRERILATAHELGYAGPDASARALRSGKAGAVGVLFTDKLAYAFSDPYAVGFLAGLAEVAEEFATSLLLMPLSSTDLAGGSNAVQQAAIDAAAIFCVP